MQSKNKEEFFLECVCVCVCGGTIAEMFSVKVWKFTSGEGEGEIYRKNRKIKTIFDSNS